MGKGNLILGTGRGKLGDAIFYRTGGEQRFRVRVKPMNPRSNAQLVQRVLVSTVVKGYSEIVSVSDHAFQNYEGKLKNHQRFMKLNIMNMRPVALSNVYSWSPIRWDRVKSGNWVKKDAPLPVVNPLIISEGDIEPIQFGFALNGSGTYVPYFGLTDTNGVSQMTYAQFANWLGVEAGDQITFVWQIAESRTSPKIVHTYISRIVLSDEDGNANVKMFANQTGSGVLPIADPNKENYGDLQIAPVEYDETQYLTILPNNDQSLRTRIAGFAVIVSRFRNEIWRRSTSQIEVAPLWANMDSMEDAVASFLRDQTSSQYLNQAQITEGEYSNVSLMNEENMIVDDNQENTPYEENSRKRGKKSE